MSEHLLNKLQIVQNSAARLLTGTSKREHISPVINNLKWLNVRNFILFRCATIIYKCINEEMPDYLKLLLNLYQPLKELRSSNDFLLEVPKNYKKISERAFFIAGPKIWNSIPLTIKLSPTLTIFKKRLKMYLLENQISAQ